ncbi:endolytic transglycosylase MltG [Acetobacteraceae bacterium]|nr:endolytic transglycosylase MltG [Acetobacteraceae bacterium]
MELFVAFFRYLGGIFKKIFYFLFDKIFRGVIFIYKYLQKTCFYQKIKNYHRLSLIFFIAATSWSFLTTKTVKNLIHFYSEPLPCIGGNQNIPISSRPRLGSILQKGKILPQSPEWRAFFNLFSKITYWQGPIRSGEYYFPPSSSFKDILHILRFSPPVVHFLSIPEGLTALQVRDTLNHAPGLEGKEVNFEEGYIFPDTYAYSLNSDRNDILSRMHTIKERALSNAWQGRDTKSLNGLIDNPFSLLILASLIEKETSLDSERSKIARVFLNRLRKNMPLQTDPTIFYALTLKGEEVPNRRLTFEHLKIESPYNTYRNKGLPPGPICSPGLASLQAAAHPDSGEALYFVANGKGGHVFSMTFAQHRKRIQQWHRSQQKPRYKTKIMPKKNT